MLVLTLEALSGLEPVYLCYEEDELGLPLESSWTGGSLSLGNPGVPGLKLPETLAATAGGGDFWTFQSQKTWVGLSKIGNLDDK